MTGAGFWLVLAASWVASGALAILILSIRSRDRLRASDLAATLLGGLLLGAVLVASVADEWRRRRPTVPCPECGRRARWLRREAATYSALCDRCWRRRRGWS